MTSKCAGYKSNKENYCISINTGSELKNRNLKSNKILSKYEILRDILVCLGCQKRIPQTGWLKSQKFIFLYF